MSDGVQATAHDNRGTDAHPYGYVYFGTKMDKRVGYAKEHGTFGGGGWEELPPPYHTEARRYLAEQGIELSAPAE